MFNFNSKAQMQASEQLKTAMTDSANPSPILSSAPTTQENPPPLPSQESAAASLIAGSDGSHIDELLTATPTTQAVAAVDVRLEKGDFHKLFCTSFVMASHLSGLKSLHVDEGDGKARAASEALYDTILEVPALHFLIQPSGQKMQRVLAVAAFALPMAVGVRNELLERRAGPRGVAQEASGNPFPEVNLSEA